LKRPFTQSRRFRRAVESLRAELESVRAELASIRSELHSMTGARASFESRVRAEILAQARSLEIYRDLVNAVLQAQQPPVNDPRSLSDPS
jgi:hypothetical protein